MIENISLVNNKISIFLKYKVFNLNIFVMFLSTDWKIGEDIFILYRFE